MLGLKKIFTKLVNLLFPERQSEKRLSNLDLDNFILRATPLLHGREMDGFLILFEYNDKLTRDAIWEMKFHKNSKAINIIARALYDRLVEELSDLSVFSGFSKPLLVPIPVTRKTLMERGYNQCEILAKELNRIDENNNFELKTNILVKTKETSDQVGKSKKQRMENIRGCFAVDDKNLVQGRNVIILDDIVTTGATMNEAKKVLKNAGAKNILCIAIAH